MKLFFAIFLSFSAFAQVADEDMKIFESLVTEAFNLCKTTPGSQVEIKSFEKQSDKEEQVQCADHICILNGKPKVEMKRCQDLKSSKSWLVVNDSERVSDGEEVDQESAPQPKAPQVQQQ
jgi:hypothetical protein